jgi:outer membrane biosynthesis protein TonB
MSRPCRVGLVLVLGTAFGCAKAAPKAPAAGRQGESSYRVLAEAEVVPGTPDPSADTTTAILPYAENAAPRYPDEALRSGCGDGLVPVRVHVGIDGRVSQTQPVPGRPVPDDPCHRAFQESVRRALAEWRFVPAYRIHRIPAPAVNEPSVERVPLGLDVDYEFRFAIVDGKGSVAF